MELEVGGPLEPWERLGFRIDAAGTCRVGAVTLRFPGDGPAGVRAWTLAGAPGDGPVNGLATRRVPAASPPAPAPAQPNGALRLDHVVVMTPDLDRTFAALDAAGLELRRVRDAGTPERPLRQGFYRAGEAILEVVGDVPPPGPARFWGLVAVVSDLDALAERLGERLGAPRDAVQPGRRIATVRESAGLGVPVAFMTPAP
jgi:catechol 2,3-dioxygenase-like lactoylglutathione lyase family enzyme